MNITLRSLDKSVGKRADTLRIEMTPDSVQATMVTRLLNATGVDCYSCSVQEGWFDIRYHPRADVTTTAAQFVRVMADATDTRIEDLNLTLNIGGAITVETAKAILNGLDEVTLPRSVPWSGVMRRGFNPVVYHLPGIII